MKRRKTLKLGGLGFFFAAAFFTCSAQPTLNWFKVSGGGGVSSNFSSGSQFTISGTIGQPDAGQPITGDAFSIVGGFWSFLGSASDLVTPPRLTIILTATNSVVVSWPAAASAGFALQQNINLYAGSGSWTTPSEPVQDDGVNRFIVVYPQTGQRFFRLFRP